MESAFLSDSSMLNRIVALALGVTVIAGQQAVAQQADQPLFGFTAAGAAAQHRLEAVYDSHLDPDDLAAWMHELAREPHHLGSSHDVRNVETLRRLFTEWGYDTEVARYEVLRPIPLTRSLTMTVPHEFTASLTERPVEGDDSSASPDVLPPYNALSPDGDVTGELVYVNYTNTDTNGRGFLSLGGSHALTKFWAEVQRDVVDPQTGLSLADRNRARIRAAGDERSRKNLAERDLTLAALGAGSDYTAFLQHLGISSANISIRGEAEGSSYHTRHDTVEHYERFGDPGHVYGVVLAKATGRATLRMANAPLLPFDFNDLASTIRRYVEEIEELADKQRAETARVNSLVESGQFAAALDPTKSLRPPPLRDAVPHFNFAPIHNALARLDDAVNGTRLFADLDAAKLDEINTLLYTAERVLLREGGLPGRPWYRHQIYSPGRYTGYAAKTLPWVREAIEQRKYDQVMPGVTALAAALNALAEQMERVKALAG